MERRLALPVLLLLGLAAGCGSSTDEESQERPTDADQRTEARLATCQDFYEDPDTPLADRAEDARAAITAGEVTDGAAYTEIDELEQRLSELSQDAHIEVTPVLAEINAPFIAVVAAVDEAGGPDAAAGVPDLSDLDVTGSATAQEQLRQECAEAGYDAD